VPYSITVRRVSGLGCSKSFLQEQPKPIKLESSSPDNTGEEKIITQLAEKTKERNGKNDG
jgi:hypothetical protein